MMKQALCLFLCFTHSLWAKDFGVQGHIYEISEPDLLKQITQKLQTLDTSGKLRAHQRKIARQAQHQLRHPQPVAGLTKTITSRTFYYNPAIRVPFDLKDHEGRVFHKKGTIFNPLKIHSLPAPLIFIDGGDPDQVTWAHHIRTLDSAAKIILTSGSPFELRDLWKHRVYFDQGGRLTTKLGILHTPARVTQEGLQLKIEEIVVESALKGAGV